jgi:hypothetical protein
MSGCNSSGGESEIECRQIAEMLGDYIDGTLPSHTRDLIDFHIDGCQACVAFVKTYKGTIGATRKLGDIPIPAELKQRLLTVLRRQRASE